MNSPYFSVIIVNFNGGDYPQRALNSLKTQTFRDFEVILLDNASTDRSADSLKPDHLPAFTLIQATENNGFARGNNLAVAKAKGIWIALLNPDAEATPNWLENIAKGIARHNGVKSFACAQYSLSKPERLDGAGDNYLLWGIPWRGGYGRARIDLPSEGECFSPCGASAVYERELFMAYGGFDEQLFCYCEDVDLGYRLRLQGERCVFLPDAVVGHEGGGLSDKVSGFALRHGSRNRLWVYLTDTPMLLLLATLPGHIVLTLVILGRGLFTGNFKASIAGILEALSNVSYILKKRHQIQTARTASIGSLVRLMPWNPFLLLNQKTFIIPT